MASQPRAACSSIECASSFYSASKVQLNVLQKADCPPSSFRGRRKRRLFLTLLRVPVLRDYLPSILRKRPASLLRLHACSQGSVTSLVCPRESSVLKTTLLLRHQTGPNGDGVSSCPRRLGKPCQHLTVLSCPSSSCLPSLPRLGMPGMLPTSAPVAPIPHDRLPWCPLPTRKVSALLQWWQAC